MKFQVYSKYSDVERFLSEVQRAADSNRSALGFLPASVYGQSAMQGKLWVAASLDGDHYCGHLLFGGSYPSLRVVQLFIAPEQRRLDVGSHLIRALIDYGEESNYISVSARVAADLPANQFWERLGFQCSKQVDGGKTTGRKINIRIRLLDVPLLFERSELQGLPPSGSSIAIEYEGAPVLQTPRYALDINSLLDLLRHRERYDAVSAMIQAGFNHIVRLVLTSEAQEELSRKGKTIEQSPALELLGQLPVLPGVLRSDLTPLIEQLRSIIFPGRSKTRKDAARDESDLTHLATCIHYRLTGFVTSERAMLRSAQEVKRQFALDVLSPLEFLEPEFDSTPRAAVLAKSGPDEIQVQDFKESNRGEAEAFLRRMGLTAEECARALHPGTSGSPRRRLTASANGDLVALASWSVPRKMKCEQELFLYSDESVSTAERIIDHLLETVFRERSSMQLCGISLFHGPDQSMTRRIALERGFRSRSGPSRSAGGLFKLSVSGIITESGWEKLANQVRNISGALLPATMPRYEQIASSGLPVQRPQRRDADMVSLFDLETLMSPGLFMFPGRPGIVIPIQERFAEDLLGSVSSQLTLLPGKEALLRVEKAYYKAPQGPKLFTKGTPITFYVSGHGGGLMGAIGSARITSSAVMSVAKALVQYSRQGVLDHEDLEKLSSRGKVHVFTFDNFARFPRPVSYRDLKDLGCVGGANLVTAQRLAYEPLLRLLSRGFQQGDTNA